MNNDDNMSLIIKIIIKFWRINYPADIINNYLVYKIISKFYYVCILNRLRSWIDY